jgi:hypothetical protein
MNDLTKVKEKHISVLAPECPDMDAAHFNACVTCTATLDKDQAVTTLRVLPIQHICLYWIV